MIRAFLPGPVSPSPEIELNMADPPASQYNISARRVFNLSYRRVKSLSSVDCSGSPTTNLSKLAKILTCGHERASEQLASLFESHFLILQEIKEVLYS